MYETKMTGRRTLLRPALMVGIPQVMNFLQVFGNSCKPGGRLAGAEKT
jgi:hypothetical protein